jgi:hypothetical protein
MNHYVYKVTNNVNGKYYYGKRSCRCSIAKDGYMGSGTKLKQELLKYGKANFTKEVLAICDSECDAYELEEMVVTLREVNEYMCYNSKCGGVAGMKGLRNTRAELVQYESID